VIVIDRAACILKGDVGRVIDSSLVDEAVERVTFIRAARPEHNVVA
jgi:hypothetical protein